MSQSSHIMQPALATLGHLLGSAPAMSRAVTSATSRRIQRTSARLYHEKVIDHYERPRNVGSLPKSSVHVGTGLVGAPACGDVMKLQILVDEETGEIRDVKFKTFGCGSAIASSSLVTEKIKGMKVWDAKTAVKNTDIAKELRLPPVKLHCSMLAEDAIKSAVKDWEAKRELRQQMKAANVESEAVRREAVAA
ncbi:FeS cluster assembly scaffold IscU [Gonapodya prolifera JEL478]|uniref:Iron-sulfur cluster assembly protein n=1 Tax=Gonapodya prolifera (strain JEL478) TaxID=1344416 RepID=A0A139AHN7_GONPJ|nr:FeS cluster assembly scaffold IscU [Gonapodya prolifera JEL478]|eukprot:KXS16326.1 FeS cluster assembly scaffold IscU [Gonapodya prolifera JEL478]